MATAPPPGIGTEAEIDQANRFAHEQGWYQDFMRSKGQDPNNVHLSDDQRDQLLQTMRDRGIGVSDHFEIDESGNIHPKSSLGKKILIGAAIGGAAMTGLGLAGIGPMAGLFGGAAETAATGIASVPALEGGGTLAANLGGAGALTAEGGLAGAAGATGALSTIGKIAGGVKGGFSTAEKIANALRMGGQAVSGAEKAAADARALQAQLALEANRENIAGMTASEQALMHRAQMEMAQRQQEQRNMARASYMQHPFQSPFAPQTGPRFSSQYMQSMGDLSNQAAVDLGQAPMYGARALPAAPTYKPIDIKDIPTATGTTPSLGSQIGNYIGPGLSLIGAFLGRNRPQDQLTGAY